MVYVPSDDDRDISESVVTSLSDISEASGRSSTPRPAEFQGWRTTRGFSGDDRSISEITEASGRSSTPRLAEFPGRRTVYVPSGDDRSISEITEASGRSSTPRLVEFPGQRTVYVPSGDDRYIPEITEASRRSSAPRPAEFQRRRTIYMPSSDDRDISEITEASRRSSTPRLVEFPGRRTVYVPSGDDRDISEITEASRRSSTPRLIEFPGRRTVYVPPGSDRDIISLAESAEASRHPSTPRPAEFKGWSVTHGFFVWMGGFMLYVNGKPRATLTSDELRHFVNVETVDMPVISEAEIKDRSKGDGLSKSIALLQLAWFVIQLVARYVQNLPITLLEIDTLAIVILTCFAYGLWWKKPKDVGCPYIVHWKAQNQPGQLTYDTEKFHSLGVGCLDRLIYPFTSLMGIGASISPRAARFRRVPSLGGYSISYHATSVRLIGCFSGMVFGAVHCLGWNYLFQRPTEHMLWRAASLGIASAPALLFLYIEYWIGWKNSRVGQYIIVCAALIISLIYVAARVTLIVLIMLSLRSLPLDAYDTVAWTQFIPHL
ncbi:hypothetical protein BDR05DRAFT_1059679 [Suillus weaverae]|nr:hypothetical protein BDR05DRAFT_1059679 [Suillus weaverae]